MSTTNLLKICNNNLKNHVYRGSFFRLLKDVTVISAENSKAIAEMTVTPEHCHEGVMTTGMAMTILDVVPFYALWSMEKPIFVFGITVSMNMTFMSPAKVGDVLTIETYCKKVGQKLTFPELDIFEKTSRRQVCHGQHVLINYMMADSRQEMEDKIVMVNNVVKGIAPLSTLKK